MNYYGQLTEGQVDLLNGIRDLLGKKSLKEEDKLYVWACLVNDYVVEGRLPLSVLHSETLGKRTAYSKFAKKAERR